MNRTLTWFAMQAGTRFANIGSEVNRAIQWRRRGDVQRSVNFCSEAIDLLD